MEQKIKELSTELLDKLGITYDDIEVYLQESDDIVRINIISDNAGLLIGHHGETINALQYILKSIIWKEKDKKGYLLIADVNNYKKNQEENVLNLAETKANLALENKTPQVLPPMSPFFRRLVHLHIANSEEYKDLSTESIGQYDQRQIKISVKE